MDPNLSQIEADALRALEKRRADVVERDYPALGGSLSVPLVSTDRREEFMLDLRRSRIVLTKGTYQNRARQIAILARLDFGGAPHRNPDGGRVESPHIHLYREGYNDKWAVPVPRDSFGDLSDSWRTFEDFMRFCNIVDPPIVKRGLFA